MMMNTVEIYFDMREISLQFLHSIIFQRNRTPLSFSSTHQFSNKKIINCTLYATFLRSKAKAENPLLPRISISMADIHKDNPNIGPM